MTILRYATSSRADGRSQSGGRIRIGIATGRELALYPATNSTLPRHGAQWNTLTGLISLVHFFKNLRHFKRIMSQLYSERTKECKKWRELQTKTASSFNRVMRKSKRPLRKRPFYYLLVNSWYVQTEFRICTYHEFNSWYHEVNSWYHEFIFMICTYR